MTAVQTIRVIAGRELVDRLRNRVYVGATAVAAVLAVVAVVFFGQVGDDAARLGVVPDDEVLGGALAAATAATEDTDVDLVELASEAEAAEAVEDGRVGAVVVDRSTLMVDDGMPAPAQATLRRVATLGMQQAVLQTELDNSGLTRTEVRRVLSAPDPPRVIQPDGGQRDAPVGLLLAHVTTGLLLAAIMLNSSLLLTGANQEKSSRVVEVLLGKARPWQLLAGKLIPLTGLALVQLTVVLGAAGAANAVVGVVELPAAAPAAVAVAVVMLAAGFALFAALFTVAGSLAVSVEHAQTASIPIQLSIMVTAFLVVTRVLPSPEGLAAQVVSFLPPTAPFTVPGRVALGVMPGWQVAVAIAITLAGAALVVGLAGRLYSAVLLAGDKLTWRDALRAEPIR